MVGQRISPSPVSTRIITIPTAKLLVLSGTTTMLSTTLPRTPTSAWQASTFFTILPKIVSVFPVAITTFLWL
jgi:hypothetical protein